MFDHFVRPFQLNNKSLKPKHGLKVPQIQKTFLSITSLARNNKFRDSENASIPK